MNYSKEYTDHIAKVMRLDPRKEWLASRLYKDAYSWCNCREDHDVNPPCNSVKKAREQVDMILEQAELVGLIDEVTVYVSPPEPKYEWESYTLNDLASMDDMEYAEFIRGMPQEELDDFIDWRREQRKKK